jgi:Cupin
MTGVVLEMEPGALRELHWHPNAAEWQYVLSGKFNVTMFGSGGRWREETLSQGDVGYIPQGFGRSIENIGAERRASSSYSTAVTTRPRPVPVDRREPDRHPGDQLFRRCIGVREISAEGCVSDQIGHHLSPQAGRGRRRRRANQLISALSFTTRTAHRARPRYGRG